MLFCIFGDEEQRSLRKKRGEKKRNIYIKVQIDEATTLTARVSK